MSESETGMYIVMYWGNDNLTTGIFPSGYRTEQDAIDAIVQSIKDEITDELDGYEDQDSRDARQLEILEELSNDKEYKFDTLDAFYTWLGPVTKAYISTFDHYHGQEILARGWHYIVQHISFPVESESESDSS